MQIRSVESNPLLRSKGGAGFTLVEVFLVIIILGIAFSIVAFQAGSVGVYKQNAFRRDFKNTVQFLFHQAIADREFYALEVDFVSQSYRAGRVVNTNIGEAEGLELGLENIEGGFVSTELNSFLNPSLGISHLIVEPERLPSLFRPRYVPEGALIERVNTPRGEFIVRDSDKALIFFSPRGFSEFASILIRLRSGNYITLVINPFTGMVQDHEGARVFRFEAIEGNA